MSIIITSLLPSLPLSAQTSADGSRLISELIHSVGRHTGFDAVMRVRASTGQQTYTRTSLFLTPMELKSVSMSLSLSLSSGLRPTGFYGAFFMQNTTDIELANVDSDKAIAVEIKHDDKLKEDDNPFFQVTTPPSHHHYIISTFDLHRQLSCTPPTEGSEG